MALVEAAEALERVREEAGGEPRALVAYMDLEGAVHPHCVELHRACSVAEGVVDEVAERLREPKPVAVEPQLVRIGDLELGASSRRASEEPVPDALEQVARRDRLPA